MGVEVLKEYRTEKRWWQEKEMVKKAGAIKLLKGKIRKISKERKYKDKKIKIKEALASSPRFFADTCWHFRGNKRVFCDVVTIIPDSEKKTLAILGSFTQELKEDEWSNKGILEKALEKACENPGIRSNSKFSTEKVIDET